MIKEDVFMKKTMRYQALFLATAMAMSLPMTALANQPAGPGVQSEEVVILYTNDAHTQIDNEGIRYSNIAEMKDELEAAGKKVLLVDAGDHIQGTAILE